MSDDLGDFERHDGNGTNGYIFRGGTTIEVLVQGSHSKEWRHKQELEEERQ